MQPGSLVSARGPFDGASLEIGVCRYLHSERRLLSVRDQTRW